jgi:hypothetical protein
LEYCSRALEERQTDVLAQESLKIYLKCVRA